MRAVEDVFVSFGLGDLSWGNMAAQFFVEKLKGFFKKEEGGGWQFGMIWEKMRSQFDDERIDWSLFREMKRESKIQSRSKLLISSVKIPYSILK